MVYVHILIALATLIVPFFLGGYLGKKLRMPEHGWKIGLSLFTLLASVVVLLLGPPLKWGVDLRGGVILVYEIDKSKQVEAGAKVDMEKLVAAIKRRLDPSGHKELTIRPYGANEIEIIVPEVDEVEVARIEKIISRAGTLEFRIVADRRKDRALIERGESAPLSTKEFRDSDNELVGRWVLVQLGQEKSFQGDPDIAARGVKRGELSRLEVLMVQDNQNVTGQYLTRAERDTDPKTGRACVGFAFNGTGAQLFGKLTGDNLPDPLLNMQRKLGIILDDELYSAPNIQSTISDRGIITGSFSEQDVKDQVNILNAGSLPAALTKEPTSKLYSGATLGQDTIDKSAKAMLIACILVPLFMLWYYRFSGVVANIALVLNMLMLIAIMVSIKAAFTLTGLAGLALTVGMAVDNNVLVYERLREEMARGATLRMAIRNAFQRASATIIDANLTTLIAATVLYVIGEDQVKGFAVTLWLGVAISMYTSVFVARVIFDIAEKRQWIKQLKMMHIIRHTDIDFMGWFPYTAMASLLITVIGLAIAVYRGPGLFDIDFTGGVSVQAFFKEPQDTGEVRELLNSQPEADRLPDLAVSDVNMLGEDRGLRFVINTSERDEPSEPGKPSERALDRVQRKLAKVFGDKLARNSVECTPPTIVQPAAKRPAEPGGEKAVGEKKAAPAAEKPVKEVPLKKPAKEAPPLKPAQPDKKSQSRRDLPANNMLAMAGRESLMLALADPPAEKPAESASPAAAKPAVEAEPAEPVKAAQPKTPPKKASPKESGAEKGAPAAKTAAPEQEAFVGGAQADLTFKTKLNYEAVKDQVTAAIEAAKVSTEPVPFMVSNPEYITGEGKAYPKWTVTMQLPPEKAKIVLSAMEQHLKDSPIFPASSTIGGTVAGKTRQLAAYALVASWVCMIIYLWVRFQGVAFGLAAVIALIHDVFVMLGAIAASIYVAPFLGFLMIDPFKINLPIVAAFLAIIGYSVNDTIVIFDRIREVRGKDPDLTRKMVNDSTNQTLSRTLLTSFTVLLVVVVLYLFGGEAVHGFAFALIVGVATGTYSSIYVASPILLWMIGKREKKAAA